MTENASSNQPPANTAPSMDEMQALALKALAVDIINKLADSPEQRQVGEYQVLIAKSEESLTKDTFEAIFYLIASQFNSIEQPKILDENTLYTNLERDINGNPIGLCFAYEQNKAKEITQPLQEHLKKCGERIKALKPAEITQFFNSEKTTNEEMKTDNSIEDLIGLLGDIAHSWQTCDVEKNNGLARLSHTINLSNLGTELTQEDIEGTLKNCLKRFSDATKELDIGFPVSFGYGNREKDGIWKVFAEVNDAVKTDHRITDDAYLDAKAAAFRRKLPAIINKAVNTAKTEAIIDRLPEYSIDSKSAKLEMSNIAHYSLAERLYDAILHGHPDGRVFEDKDGKRQLMAHISTEQAGLLKDGSLDVAVECFNELISEASDMPKGKCPAHIYSILEASSDRPYVPTGMEADIKEGVNALTQPPGADITFGFANTEGYEQLNDFLLTHRDAFKQSIKEHLLGGNHISTAIN